MGLFDHFFKEDRKPTVSVAHPRPAFVEEETFGGVSLSQLNSLAANYGGRVKKSGDRLVFIFNSNRKRDGHRVDYCIIDGKLHQMSYVANYPGRGYFPEIDFMNAANEKFCFSE